MNKNFNMSFDPTTREQFAALTATYGLTVAQAFKLFAKQAINTGILPLSFNWASPTRQDEAEEVLNEQSLRAIARTEADYKTGKVEKFAPDEAIQRLQELARG